jgi:hypothetical protein
VTAQAIGSETVFQFLDAVLAFSASLVEGENLLRWSSAVGDEETRTAAVAFRFYADAARVAASEVICPPSNCATIRRFRWKGKRSCA